MSDTAEQFLKSLSVPVLMVVAFCYMLLTLTCVSVPMNYAAASLPFWITFYYWLKEMDRRHKLGFAHDRVREVPEEDMEKALEELAKTRKL